MSESRSTKRVKIVSTGLIFSAIALQLWHRIAPLPPFLQSVSAIAQIALTIHAIEGIAAAVLIALYRQSRKEPLAQQTNTLLIDHLPKSTPLAILKAGLYTFFVGTVGLSEIVQATKSNLNQTS